MIYTNDFPEISRKLREEYSWTCSKCKVDMSNMKAGLHVHHKNGVKNDNDRSNLQVLCALCHQGIDEFHKKMHVSEKQRTLFSLIDPSNHLSENVALATPKPVRNSLLDIFLSQNLVV